MMQRSEFNGRWISTGAAIAALLVTSVAHAQAPTTTTTTTPVAAPTPEVPAPVYAPPPSNLETLPATPAPTPYAGTTPAAPTAPTAPPTGYPTPGAPAAPPASGFDFGGQALTPLPPPPASLDPSRMRMQPWRGRYWLGFRLVFTGPVGGEVPARPNLLTLGGGADFGVRINNVIGVGMGLSGHKQNRINATVDGTGGLTRRTLTGSVLYWDALFVRLHAPLKKRFQPYIEVGGGLSRLLRAEGGRVYGAQMRVGLGIEGWVSRSVTIGVSGVYRLNALNDKDAGRWLVGHAMQGVAELGFHW